MFYFLNNLFIRIILAGFFAMYATRASSQSVIESQNVDVTFNKTSSLVFPAAITSVDRGSRDVLAQKAKGVNNILQLKAGKTNFRETNLTVITADGKLHHFAVRYSDKPAVFTLMANNGEGAKAPFPLLFQSEMTASELEYYATEIISSYEKGRLESTSEFDMRLSLLGIYIQDNIMFYHLGITNKSNIPYHTDMLRFSVRDKRQAKRTASQEVSESPIFQYGSTEVINGKSTVDVVYAIPKFTIPDAKLLSIELKEKRGGRHLRLAIKNKQIIRARPVSDY